MQHTSISELRSNALSHLRETICILTIALQIVRIKSIDYFLYIRKGIYVSHFIINPITTRVGHSFENFYIPFHALQHTRVRPEDLPDLTSIFHQIKLKPGRVIAHKDEGRRIKSSSTKLHDPPVTHRGGGDESN